MIEVLVVVAIIALLVALLIPSLSRARSQGRVVGCLANLRQLALAWNQYLDAHGGRFLHGPNVDIKYGGRIPASPSFRGPRPLNKYLNLPSIVADAEIFRCKGENITPPFYQYFGTSYLTNPMLIGYGVNVYAFTPSDDADPDKDCTDVFLTMKDRFDGLNRSDVMDESRMVLLGDFNWVKHWLPKTQPGSIWHDRAGKFNLAFLDGHAAFLRVQKGMHVTGDYTVLPFRDLQTPACDCQAPAADP